MPTIGDAIRYQSASGRWHGARVTAIGASTVDLDAYGDGAAWPTGEPPGVLIKHVAGVSAGSGTGQYDSSNLSLTGWLANASDLISTNNQANAALNEIGDPDFGNQALLTAVQALPTFADVASAITAVPDASSRCAQATAGTSVSLALNTARNPSAVRSDSRGTRVRVSGTWTSTVTASGTVELRSDSATTPTTVRDNQSCAVTLGIGVGVTTPWSLEYDVPAGHYYEAVTSGTGTFAITHCNETVQ